MGCSTTIIPSTSPLREVVTVGVPILIFPESAITITSASKSSWNSFKNSAIHGDPISSSPSIKILILTGRSSMSAFATS